MRSLLILLAATLPLAVAQTPAAVHKAPIMSMSAANFKESGSPSAKVQIEIYTDYQCPACRELYMNILPSLTKDYVQTGKVHLVHRDFPLPQHQFTLTATKYANSAGMIGKYDIVAAQIFKTQPEWEQNGNVDAEVAKVLSPADMQKVRELVKADPASMEDSVRADQAMGNRDRLNQTPTIVIVANGKRDVIGGITPYPILKSYIDKKLAQ
ncbi:MAG TPA: thioredoxin domain-containing protein [Bryobacteraceae bacterium]|nr:thioredoxin domain-containing protein [Bryobacteraceae bacterium]